MPRVPAHRSFLSRHARPIRKPVHALDGFSSPGRTSAMARMPVEFSTMPQSPAVVLRGFYDRLLAAYGPQHWWPADTPTEVAIGAILTQNTAWGNVEQAIKRLEQAHRDLGRNWTVTAQHAGTTYLLVLFGQEGHLRDVTENYRNALSGQEDASYVQPLRDRLAALERR